ncbi:protein of unknown function [Neorhodopirellula lusitana]|uniref:3-keto-alpha-glucoside-1,2-lyase/3-keto-2-hydroxy-glucal hydratase domain-containing protein n=1 Tax=Neorhodopirellula lusitana TaxID=445327 RepID=A0ABY1PRW2_9BACT|nr:DUF1080 domain-containing protein [Neorhodopirellula lusitana]SMP42622.1 protein of unknown function [Neorhodopirellula lusitana]
MNSRLTALLLGLAIVSVANPQSLIAQHLETKPANKQPIPPADPDTPTWTDPELAQLQSPAFGYMGEYRQGEQAIQVVPCQGRFYLSIYQGGLPGAGWDGSTIAHEWIDKDAIESRLNGLTKVDRSAQLDFTAPPANATVLFDGNGTEHWSFAKVKNGLLQAGAKTKENFQDFRLHFETMVPFKPELQLAHPDRGNSGVFALGAYEVQVCDTFGIDFAPDRWDTDKVLKTPSTWCGGIYGIKPADVNICLPPLAWQTFDVEFTAARFQDDQKVSSARMTIWQNGVLIHNDVTLPSGTGGGPSGPRAEVPAGPIYIQNHHNPTQYRNVWIVKTNTGS